jgi:tRNA (Thr-GGU) A37 N-methylase
MMDDTQPEKDSGTGHEIVYYAIGHVENGLDEPAPPPEIRASESRIVIDPSLTEGLRGLAPGRRMLVVFCFHRSRGFDLLRHPRGDRSRPRRGGFTLRSPHRPNPVGVTEVDLWPQRETCCACGAWMRSTARSCRISSRPDRVCPPP